MYDAISLARKRAALAISSACLLHICCGSLATYEHRSDVKVDDPVQVLVCIVIICRILCQNQALERNRPHYPRIRISTCAVMILRNIERG